MHSVPPRTSTRFPSLGQHAVVMGAGITGLLVARSLVDFFDKVTLVERDSAVDERRRGIPQSRHTHLMMRKGAQLLERFFPGLDDALEAAGAESYDWTDDFAQFLPNGWAEQFVSGRLGRACSRDLLEKTIRVRLARYPRIVWRDQTDVVGFKLAARNRLSAVLLRAKEAGSEGADASSTETEAIEADWFVDATGRNSKTDKWLKELGLPAVRESVIDSHLGYASRVYQRDLRKPRSWKALAVFADPPHQTRSAMVWPLENNRWLVTLQGVSRDYPPTDEAGFLAFAKSLPDGEVYNAIQHAQPLSEVYGYRDTRNHRRYYEQMKQWPERLIVLGDAACALNPTYGQGMTISALGVEILTQSLREESQLGKGLSPDLAKRIQKRLGEMVDVPWMISTSEDSRWPLTEGRVDSAVTRVAQAYIHKFLHLVFTNRAARLMFLDVLHMVKPPSALFRPDLFVKTLFVKKPPSRSNRVTAHPAAWSGPPPTPKDQPSELLETSEGNR